MYQIQGSARHSSVRWERRVTATVCGCAGSILPWLRDFAPFALTGSLARGCSIGEQKATT